MLRYLIKRLFALIPVLLAVAFLIFTMMYFTPGDPATIILGDQASPEQVAEWRAARDLDKPFLTQFGIYLSKIVFHGDFGISYKTGKNVNLGFVRAVSDHFHSRRGYMRHCYCPWGLIRNISCKSSRILD